MKNLLVICCVFLVCEAFSQTSKESVYIGASSTSLNLGSQFVKGGSKQSNFQLSGVGGLFLIDDLMLNIRLGFGRNKANNVTTQNLSIGPGLRYYFDNIYLGASNDFVFYKVQNPGNDTNLNNMLTLFELGYAAFLSRSIAIEPALYYSLQTGDGPGIRSIGFKVGFGFYSRKN